MYGSATTMRRLRRQEELTAWLFIAPVVLGILVFQVYPVIFSSYISLTEWNLLTSPRWVALRNYAELLTRDRFFWKALGNTAKFAVGTVIPGLILSLFFASLLNQNIRGKYVYRAIYFVPVVAPAVSVALLWQIIYEPNFGILNSILRFFGIRGPTWLGSTKWAMPAVIIEDIWASLGFMIVIFLAGLQGISREYYEAAAIDGANALQQLRHITFPLISPVTFFLLVTGLISSFQAFSVPFVMTGGGPANATLMIVMYLYNHAFRQQHMGFASAIAYVVFLVIIFFTVINFVASRRWVFYEEVV
jgi:multiple sugar transport system permease protein